MTTIYSTAEAAPATAFGGFPRLLGDSLTLRIDRRHHGAARERQSEGFRHHSHGIGGKLTTTGAS